MGNRRKFLSSLCVSAVCALAGCGGVDAPPVTSTGTTYGNTNASVYVIQGSNGYSDQVLQFPPGSTGTVAPTFTVTTNLSLAAVAVDSGQRIYAAGVTSTGAGVVTIYGTLNDTVGTIALPAQPIAIALDASGNMYVTDTSSEILVYTNRTLTRTIAGTATGIGTPQSIAVDSAGTVYLSSYTRATGVSTILEFNSAANGNVAPTNTITSSANSAFYGVAVDAAKNVYSTTTPLTQTGIYSVVEYAAGATGTATPVKTISGSATLLSSTGVDVGGLAIDTAGNLYLPIASGSNSSTFSVLEFAAGANGNATPASRVRSTAWTNAGSQIAVM